MAIHTKLNEPIRRVLNEQRLTLAEAADELGIHVASVHRYRLKGVRGVRLSCFMIGGLRYTSRERLEEFVAATTAAAENNELPAATRTPNQRERAAERAEKKLEAAGI